jgi:alcohol dehydrogenase class IV
MRTTWTFHSAGQLVFGRHAARQLGELAVRLRVKRLLIVTDPTLVGAGLVEQVRPSLDSHGLTVEVFDGGAPEPALGVAQACYEAARHFGPDALLGLGGGSNMDVAKLTATLLAHAGTPYDYLGDDRIPGPIHPLICVPTTAGTGSEVSGAAAFTDAAQQVKVGMLSNYLRPTLAVVDPLLTVSCPPKVTADSGIDALTHAIEAFTAVDNADFPLPPTERSVYQGRHPFGDLFAAEAIGLCGRYLRRAVRDGSDLEARDGMALAATTGGLAFSNVGVALVHALEYPVGGATGCSHGLGNGLLLPYVMRFNLPARRRELARVASLLGEDVGGLTEDEAAGRAVAAVERLRADVGIPARLSDLGVRSEQLRTFAEKTFAIKRILRVNPRPASVDDLEGILREAL